MCINQPFIVVPLITYIYYLYKLPEFFCDVYMHETSWLQITKHILQLHDGRWGSVQDWKIDAGARSTATNTKTWEPVHKLFDHF